jgi:hypothetical protein
MFELLAVPQSGGARVGAVVEAMRYKLEGRGVDSRSCHWIFFHRHNTSGRTMVLGSTQPPTEMSTVEPRFTNLVPGGRS